MPSGWQSSPATRPDLALPWRQTDPTCRCCQANVPISTTSIPVVTFDPTRLWPAVRLALTNRVTPLPPCRLAGYTRSLVVVSFWFAQSLIEIESPTGRRPRMLALASTSSTLSPSIMRWATRLFLCHLIGLQHRRPCVRIYIAIIVHLPLCYAIPVAPSVWQGLRPVDWVFDSLSSSCCYTHRRWDLLADASSPTLLLLRPAQPHGWGPLPCTPVLATPMHAFVPNVLLDLANLATPRCSGGFDCIDFGIDPRLPQFHRRLSSRLRWPWLHQLRHLPLPRWLLRCVSVITMVPLVHLAPSTWQPNHNYVNLGHLQHSFFDHSYCALTLGYLNNGTKGYRLAWRLIGFFSSHSYRVHQLLWLRGDVSFVNFSRLCSAPAVTAGRS